MEVLETAALGGGKTSLPLQCWVMYGADWKGWDGTAGEYQVL